MTNVLPLFQPSNARIDLIRTWHQRQAVRADSVATLNVSITADGKVHCQALAIEPEHAAAMLDELRAAVARLECFASEFAPELMNRATKQQGGTRNGLNALAWSDLKSDQI